MRWNSPRKVHLDSVSDKSVLVSGVLTSGFYSFTLRCYFTRALLTLNR